MKKSQRGSASVALMLAILFFLVAIELIADKASCSGKWEDSGFATRWGPIKGCVVQTPSGRWLPSDSIREIDLRDLPRNESK